jgi:hypothetical protein
MLKSTLKILYKNLPAFLKKLVHRDNKRKYINSARIPWTTGYAEYKYDYIGNFVNSDKLDLFLGNSLPPEFGYRLDERAVEYPWFLSRLKDNEIAILDAGSVLNFHQIIAAKKLRNKKLYISTLSYEGILGITPSPSYIYEDLRDTCFKNDFFDAICCISTLEHAGMDNTMLYTPDETKREQDSHAYLGVLKEFARILRRRGTLYLTVPYGKYKNFGWFQVFDKEMVSRALDTFNPSRVEITYFKYENDQWNFSSEEHCRDSSFFDINTQKEYERDYLAGARSVICLEMTG